MTTEILISLITLTFLEIVLGVDNIIFVSIVAQQVEHSQQAKARNYGLMLAMVMRLVLLLGVKFILSLEEPLFQLPDFGILDLPIQISFKDLILIGGGVFLLYKSTIEIHQKLEGEDEELHSKKKMSLTKVILQICFVNIVFSFDSILTAIGMTKIIWVMMVAVVLSIAMMMVFSAAISKFINTHPTMQMLALSFLILIGVMLVAEGFHQPVSKGYLYFSIAFSLGVEVLNMRFFRNKKKLKKGRVESGELRVES